MRKKALPRSVAEERARALLAEADIEVVPLTDEIGRAALDALERYGKGRSHPAQLNLADCFASACAKVYLVPLLYKGDDFRRTDLA
jgi:ribonuclease VapC